MTREELGTALAQLRQKQGITIRQMAERCATSTRAIQAVEKGWYNVGINTYLALAQQLGVELQITPSGRTKAQND
jgi:transcriptional regulator with XRE-family HTH domain